MLISKIHSGSGLGNQLHSYLMARILALDKGLDFGYVGIENFKGSFFNLDWGKPVNLKWHTEMPSGFLVVDDEHKLFEEKILDYNPEIKNIVDGMVIDGYWQSERYFEHHLPEIREWLKVEPLEMPDDLCIINIRGGEFRGTDFELPKEYWKKAMEIMALKYPGIKFKIVTDDVDYAKKLLSLVPVSHEISNDWRSIRYAKHLILSHSSFAILPALLNEDVKEVIAPKWRHPMNEYKFTYL